MLILIQRLIGKRPTTSAMAGIVSGSRQINSTIRLSLGRRSRTQTMVGRSRTSIAIEVGLFPISRWMRINISDSILMLSFFYLILVMPYSYRALDAGLAAIDIKTLSEAARSLGAGWGTVMLRVIVPNMSSAILNACLLSVAVVLGEYTFANLLTYENLQVAIAYVGLVSAGTSIAVAVASLLFAFVLLMVLSFVGRPRERMARAEETIVAPESRILPLRD